MRKVEAKMKSINILGVRPAKLPLRMQGTSWHFGSDWSGFLSANSVAFLAAAARDFTV